jgi:hypothetical protein
MELESHIFTLRKAAIEISKLTKMTRHGGKESEGIWNALAFIMN